MLMRPIKNMRLITIIILLTFQTLLADKLFTLEEAKKNGMQETLQNYIKHNSIIVDTCVFEQTWIPATKNFPKGQLIQRAVVTYVHSGSLKVGDRIEYTYYIEDSPLLFKEFTSTVKGELRTFFFEPDEGEKVVDGILKIEGMSHWGFKRVEDVFSELFALEIITNSKLNKRANKAK